jgi:hypothetical protein
VREFEVFLLELGVSTIMALDTAQDLHVFLLERAYVSLAHRLQRLKVVLFGGTLD